MNVKLLTKHHLEFLGLKGSCRGSSESTFVKMPHCWKSHVAAHLYFSFSVYFRYVVFRPFTDEIMVGKIKSCSKEGVNGELILLPLNY